MYKFIFFTEINIESFLNYYRETFPTASVTPKLHMLEDHVVPFLRRWRVGFGFHGEQGAESLHATFNKIRRSYMAIPDRVKRLKCVVKEHHLQVSPTLVALEPHQGRSTRKIGGSEKHLDNQPLSWAASCRAPPFLTS
jgi:hypothetical protein